MVRNRELRKIIHQYFFLGGGDLVIEIIYDIIIMLESIMLIDKWK